MMPRSAMIFAAGFGTRMGDLTKNTPKPMLEVAGRPMIDRTIELLRDAGVDNLVANTHYLSEKIEPFLSAAGVTVLYENPILETGGGLRAARKALDSEPVITMNPDAVWIGQNPVKALTEAWRPEMTALLMLIPLQDDAKSDFKLENGEIQRAGSFRYSGLQIIRADRLVEIDEEVFSLNQYWDLLMATGPVHGCVYDGTWIDIGTHDALKEANQRMQQ